MYYLLIILLTSFTFSKPIVVQSSLPDSDLLYGKTPITLIFSQAVELLGFEQNSTIQILGLNSDFTGKGRWVTTSIYRFDPFQNWPSDLLITIIVPEQFNFKGTPVHYFSRKYKTLPSTFSITNVASQKAMNLTGGHWNYASYSKGALLIEVPPDGNITVSFNGNVNHTSILDSFRIKDEENSEIPFDMSVSNDRKSDIFIVPQSESLKTNHTYRLVLLQGSNPIEFGGRTKDDVVVEFHGLLPFQFPFLEHLGLVSYYDYRLYLRHGLADSSIEGLQRIQDAIHFFPPVKFNLTYSKYYISLIGKFSPNQQYVISVDNNTGIMDGFYLSLYGNSLTFNTSDKSRFVVDALDHQNIVQFEENFNSNWSFFSRCSQGDYQCQVCRIGAKNIDMSNIKEAIATYIYQKDFTGSITTSVGKKNSYPNGNYDEIQYDTSKLWKSSGLWIYNKWSYCESGDYLTPSFVSRNNFNIMAMVAQEKIKVWISQSDHKETMCQNCLIYVYGAQRGFYDINGGPNKVELLGQTTSDSFGFGSLSIQGNEEKTLFIVIKSGDLIQITNPSSFYPQMQLHDILHYKIATDKGFYKPLEEVHIKGFVRMRNYNTRELVMGNLANSVWTMTILWGPSFSMNYPVTVSDMGTFNISIPIPNNSTFGYKFATIQANSQLSSDTGYATNQMSFQLLIGDPRVPTTKLSLLSNSTRFKPGTQIPLNIELSTYSGVSIPDAQINIKWTLTRAKPISSTLPSSKSVDSGEFPIQTGKDGKLEYQFSLSSLLSTTEENGDALQVTAEYLSPTKELLKEKLDLTIEATPLSLIMTPSLSGRIIPKMPFGVFVSARSSNILEKGLSKEITVALYEWREGALNVTKETGSLKIMNHVSVKTCKLFSTVQLLNEDKITGEGDIHFHCHDLELPAIGKYLLVASVLDTSGYIATNTVEIGETEENWKDRPLSTWNIPEFKVGQSTFSIGDTAKIEFYHPFQSLSVLTLLGRSNQYNVSHHGSGLCTIEIPITKDSCSAPSCLLNIFVSKPRDNTGVELAVVESNLFDWYAPTTFTFTLTLQIKEEQANYLQVDIKTPDVVLPGSFSEIEVSVTQALGSVPVDSEVCIFVVDKAVLDLKPNPVVLFNETVYIYESFPSMVQAATRALARGYKISLETIRRRLAYSPYYFPTWDLVSDEYSKKNVDMSDAEYFNTTYTLLTDFPPYFSPYTRYYNGGVKMRGGGETLYLDGMSMSQPMADGASPSMMAKEESVGAGGESNQIEKVTLRTNFKSTPLFIGKLQTGPTGKASVKWQLPDNIGQFEVRAYAISKEGLFGVSTKNLISRKLLSIQPSLPRVVRTSDEYLSGLAITVHDESFDEEVEISVYRVCNLLEIVGDAKVTMRLRGANVFKIDFRFLALGTGTSEIIFKVSRTQSSKENILDAALFSQDINGRQEEIFIATSMAVSADSPALEGFRPPEAEQYSGKLEIQAGVGRFPAVAFFSSVALRQASQVRPSAYDLLTGLLPKIILERYNKINDVSYKSTRAQFDRSLKLLDRYLVAPFGLQYQLYEGNYFFYTDSYLQAYALFILKEIKVDWNIKALTSALENELYRQVNQAIAASVKYSNFDQLAFAYLGLGPLWQPTQHEDQLSLSHLIANKGTLSASSKAALAIVLLRNGQWDDGVVSSLLRGLENTFRVQGRTAYITHGQGQDQPALLASALALTAFTLHNNTSPLVEKLANFLSLVDSKQFHWPYYMQAELAHLMLGLTLYDQRKGNTEPELHLRVTSNGTSLLDLDFTKQSEQHTNKEIFYEDVPDLNDIQFSATGKGEASLVFGATFVPKELSNTSLYRGIQVKKVVRNIDFATNLPVGPPLNSSKIGTQLMVTIEITIPDFSHQIVIVDPLSGALEAMDENIFGVIPKPIELYTDYWSWYIENMFSTREYRSDKVIFVGFNVRAGTHSVSYVTLVATEGVFTLPPAKAYDANQPELMGLSPGNIFSTTEFSSPANIKPVQNEYCIPWIKREIDFSKSPAWMQSLKPPALPGPNEGIETQSVPEQRHNSGDWELPALTFLAAFVCLVIAACISRKKNGDGVGQGGAVDTEIPMRVLHNNS